MLNVHFLGVSLIIGYPNIQTLICRINHTEFKGRSIIAQERVIIPCIFKRAHGEGPKDPCKGDEAYMHLPESFLPLSGASLGNVSVTNLSKPVEIIFSHNHSLRACFSPGEDNLGEWRTEGCETDVSQENVVICKCNHLTYFAVLLQLSSEPLDEKLLAPLTYLSDIGCGISASACFITIFLYLFTSKTWVGHTWWCSIRAAFLHYSLLCSMTWMAIEGFHLYLLVIQVYNSYISHYLLKLSAVGWGLPGPIILVSFLSMQNVYVVQKLRQLRAHPLHRPKEHTCKDVGTVLWMTFLLGTTWMLFFISFGVFFEPSSVSGFAFYGVIQHPNTQLDSLSHLGSCEKKNPYNRITCSSSTLGFVEQKIQRDMKEETGEKRKQTNQRKRNEIQNGGGWGEADWKEIVEV
ncbi:hypothetical protein E2320_001022 [Naja naja]|nr:hypothetical protein E2320_001022 [Naja naja]